MAIHQIISLLGFCLKNTYFVLQGSLLWATRGCSNGITNKPHSGQLIYGGVWSQSPQYITTPLKSVKRFVNDAFVVIKSTHKEEFLKHINSIDEGIRCTAENTKADGSMPLFDTLVIPQCDASLITTVFRNQVTLTNFCSGTAIMPYLQNTVWLVHCFTGLKLYAPPRSIFMKNMNT